MKRILVLGLCGLILASSLGCGWSRKAKGAAIGAGAGAAVGAAIGHEAGNTAAGAILGAVIGGAAGAYIGNYMDKQAAEIERDLEGARVERIGEGIKITFESGILFDVNSSALQPVAKSDLAKLAGILNKYPDTDVLVEGHTDSTGPHDYNLDLSLRRAQSVATNDTREGRQANRRVEIAIFANDKLKDAARKKVEES